MRGSDARSASESLSGCLTMPPTSSRHTPRVASSHTGTWSRDEVRREMRARRLRARAEARPSTYGGTAARSSDSFLRSANLSSGFADCGPIESHAARTQRAERAAAAARKRRRSMPSRSAGCDAHDAMMPRGVT